MRFFPYFALPFAFVAAPGHAQIAPRETQELAGGWKFIRADAGLTADTSAWETVAVPHTWNALDGQDHHTPGATARPGERGSDYFRGVTWYARPLDLPSAWQGRRVFIIFEAASQVAKVFLNGQPLGEHRGSFTAFAFELTPHLKFGGPNELRVQVDNTLDRTIAPLAGYFNVDGGLYRPVHLLVTDPVCVTPLDHASPGVYLTTKSLRDTEAQVEVKALVSNGAPAAVSGEAVTEIREPSGRVVATRRTPFNLAPGDAAQAVTEALTVASPHRWNGLSDAYVYSVAVQIVLAGRVVDEVVQPLGLRTLAITEADGFLLNGRPYPIYGVNRHQDLRDHGWALTAADHERDVALIGEVGATAIRLAHYPQSDYFHTLCDRAGLLLWNEVPFVNETPNPAEPPDQPSAQTQAFNANLEEQLREMILQRYNHPSIAFWGLFNELRPGQMNTVALPEVRRLNALAHELDPARITVGASDKLANPTNFIPDRIAYNVYPGWYSAFGSGPTGDIGGLVGQRFAEQKNRRVALSEYGAGGNPAQHQEGPPDAPQANGGPVHPEEWQAYVHERDWAQLQNNPRLWGTFVWAMFDFSSDGRSEGGQDGINDKGLVTQDRRVKKDAFYFYQANWSRTPMVYIASRRMTPRTQAVTEVKVYSNCPEVELLLYGVSLGRVKPDAIRVARWPKVRLQPGANPVVAIGRTGNQEVRDTCTWTLTPIPAQ